MQVLRHGAKRKLREFLGSLGFGHERQRRDEGIDIGLYMAAAPAAAPNQVIQADRLEQAQQTFFEISLGPFSVERDGSEHQVRPSAVHQVPGFQQMGLAGAVLPDDHIQPRAKRQLRRGEDGEVLQPQCFQHRKLLKYPD